MFHRHTSNHPQSSHQRFPIRRQHRNIPCSMRLVSHAQRHPIPTSRTCSGTTGLQNIGLAQGWQASPQRHTLNEVHPGHPKAPSSTPPCMFHHRTSHQPSSSQPKLEGNIATFHSQQGSCRTPKEAPNTASPRKFRHRTAAVNHPRPPTTTPTPQAYAHVRRIVLGAWGWRKI